MVKYEHTLTGIMSLVTILRHLRRISPAADGLAIPAPQRAPAAGARRTVAAARQRALEGVGWSKTAEQEYQHDQAHDPA